jgi:hypothetical protein
MEKLWGSIDVISYSGGKATIDTLSGSLEKRGSKDPLFAQQGVKPPLTL